ncbi:MAG: type II toxin-antitoxin system VapC family toxin [Candidatus Eisenbacteria sp.]|nr:type II toxin-antitoxin system VapC family toxin [Candidatus Eisenbacteria bacterium]
MNVIDSSAWLEYFANGPNAAFFAPAIEKTADLIVPSLTLYEVFKRILQQRDEGAALHAVAAMQQGRIVDLDASLALTAARISTDRKLPMADSIILATAATLGAELWTQDADFKGLPGVHYRKRKPQRTTG